MSLLNNLIKLAENYKTVISQQLVLFKEECKLTLISAKWFAILSLMLLVLVLSFWATILVALVLYIKTLAGSYLVAVLITLGLQSLLIIALLYALHKLITAMSFKHTRQHLKLFATKTGASIQTAVDESNQAPQREESL